MTLPTVDHISESLSSNIGLLADARDVTLEELHRGARCCSRCRRRGSPRAAPARATSSGCARRSRPTPPALDTQERVRPQRATSTRRCIECCGNTLLADRGAAGLLGASDEPRALGARPHASTARSTRTTRGSSRRSRRATRTPPARRCTSHLEFLVPVLREGVAAAPAAAAGRDACRSRTSAILAVEQFGAGPVGHAPARRPRRRGDQDRGSGRRAATSAATCRRSRRARTRSSSRPSTAASGASRSTSAIRRRAAVLAGPRPRLRRRLLEPARRPARASSGSPTTS